MILSQSKIKAWETTECKKKVIAEMKGEVVYDPTEQMLRGSFFETKCLGSGVKGQMTDDLPRLASGKKSIEQIRIEDQVQQFKNMFDPESTEFMGWLIVDKQLHITNSTREGTIDFVCKRDGITSIWDLKLTSDMMSPGGWWAAPQRMDHIQLTTYKDLYREKYGDDCETYYALFDYSPKKNIKILKINISEETLVNSLQRFDVVNESLVEYLLFDEYPATPSYYECARCKVSCGERTMRPLVKFEEYDI
jgi:hypothetical protein